MPENQEKLASLFDAACEIESESERNAFLARECGDDHDLKEQVAQLLRSNDISDVFLEDPLVDLSATIVQESLDGSHAEFDSADSSASTGDHAAIQLRDVDRSVLRSMGNSLSEVPHVSLRESKTEIDDPIMRPTSPEVPVHPADSRYQLHGEIARGGMGAIIKGRDIDLGRDLAIKVLLDSQKDNPEVVRRFVEEAQIGGQLQHPGIVPVYELGQFADHRPFFSMKLVKGKTLAKLLAERQEPDAERGRFIGIFEDICQTLAYAHSRGVIHRDLKPANIMVGAFGEVQVMDWGLAKVLTDGGVADENKARNRQKHLSAIKTLRNRVTNGSPGTEAAVGTETQMGSIMGTPAYMSPEQALGDIDHLDERADVFGLGAILCEILTGKPPYIGEDGTAIFHRASQGQLEETIERLSAANADPNLIALTKSCLEFDPDARPRDAGELAKQVTEHLESVEAKLHETEKQRAVAAARAEEERKRRHIQLALIASILLMFGVAGTGWKYLERLSSQKQQQLIAEKQEQQNDAEATRLVEGLLQADTLQVGNIIENVAKYRKWAEDELKTAYLHSPDGSNSKLHAALAILPTDVSVLPFLQKRLLTVTAVQFESVRDLMQPHSLQLISEYWAVARDTAEAKSRRFRAACVLASYDSTNEHWQNVDFVDFVAEELVGVLPSELLPWRNALRPVKQYLDEPLTRIFGDDNRDTLARGFVTDTLAEYRKDDVGSLFDLLAESDDKQFAVLYDRLVVHKEQAVYQANLEIARVAAPESSEVDKESLAVRKANAANMLLRMNAADQVWSLLKAGSDVRARNYIIHWWPSRGGGSNAILNRFEQESDASIRRSLLFTLGEFEESAFPDSIREAFARELMTLYRTEPDAGLRAASEWLLRRWGKTEAIDEINRGLRDEGNRSIANPGWYVNSQGQNFVVIDAGTFRMGASDFERERFAEEVLHERCINRRFAICSTEVTRSQWRQFCESQPDAVWKADQPQMQPHMRTADSPMLGMTWFEAARYCNWLSEQEGIQADQWCYETNENQQYGPGMKVRTNFWKLQGYRLPTEAEWEFACRAHTATIRYYGSSETLLPKFSWFLGNSDGHSSSVATLKPNDFGLFDMHGNAYEWCQDRYRNDPSNGADVVVDAPIAGSVNDDESRVIRGGAYDARASGLRSASRAPYRASSRSSTAGFRPVKTIREFTNLE